MGDGGDLLPDLLQTPLGPLYALICGCLFAGTHGPAPLPGVLTLSLLDLLKADPEVLERLSANELNALFDLGYHLKHVDTIFDRVFGNAG